MKKIFFIFILAAIVVLACNPQKKIIKEPIKEKGADYLFSMLKKNEFKFDYLNIKFSADFEMNNKTNSFSGTMRIRKDSAVWMSISALGLEAFRAVITHDSVKMLNRLDNTYYAESFSFLNSLFNTNIDFDMLQALVTGNDFSLYQGDVFKASIDNKQYKLSTVGRGKLKKYISTTEDSLRLLMQDIWLDDVTFKINKVMLKEVKENRKIEVVYSDFTILDSMNIAKKMDFELTNVTKKIKLTINSGKISRTGPLEFPFTISSKYTRVKQ